MNTTELLNRFCGENDIREYLNAPIRRGGYLYACNGHIAVKVADDPAVSAHVADGDEKRTVVVERLEKMLADAYQSNGHVLAETNAVQVLESAGECRRCAGSAVESGCEECDGSGEIVYEGKRRSYTVECPACFGDSFPEGASCWSCRGSGKDTRHKPIHLDHAYYSLRYIALLAELPNATLFNPEPGDDPHELRSGLIRFDGGLALVMPIYPPPEEVPA